MEIIADASVFLAVALHESERRWIVDKTAGAALLSPAVLPYEIGNALVAIVKRRRLSQDEALEAQGIAQAIPVRLVPVDVKKAVQIAFLEKCYAYDAYYLQCALESGLPLLTLDAKMRRSARNLNIAVLE